MRASLLAISALVSGCTTSAVTGGKKFLGLLPVPFTKPSVPPTLTDKQIMISQFAPFQWAALALIVGGAFVWWSTKGSTGFGIFLVGLGVSLSAFAVAMPQIAGWIGLIALVGMVALAVYFIYKWLTPKPGSDQSA